jgi:F-type H+-transporting ATPase subunit b
MKLSFNILLTALYILITANSVFASAGGGESHGIAWGELLWPAINFAIIAGVLIFFTRKPFGEYFKNRTANIEKSIKEATEAKEIAEKTLTEVRDRLNNTEQETNKIIEAARKTGEKEKESLIAEGEHIKQRIVEQAKASIEFELDKAQQEIKTEAALLALEAAEEEIKKRLGGGEQEKLIEEYIKKIEVKS